MIKIGIIGPTWLERRIKENLKMFPSFNPIYRISNNIYDAIPFTEELEQQCEIILYSGYIPYYISREARRGNIPAHFIPIKGAALYRAFYRLKKKAPIMHKVSLDTLTKKELATLNEELDEQIQGVHYDSKISLVDTKEIVTFHAENYTLNKTDCALTSLKVVADALDKMSIPNEWLLPTEGDLIVTLERALLSTEKRRQLESQIVFGIIRIENFEKLKQQVPNEQSIYRLNIQIQQVILDFVESLEGHLTSLHGNEYMFITTRGTFERVTQGYKYFPLFDDKRKSNMSIIAGIGFGITASEAGTHARMALLQAKEYGEEKCFIVKEDRSVIGPIENEIPLTYPLTITDKNLIKKAEDFSISPHYLQKAISILKRKRKGTFTASELANSLGVTTRSANRLIVSWLDAKIVKVVGVEKLQTRGRPRQVYELIY